MKQRIFLSSLTEMLLLKVHSSLLIFRQKSLKVETESTCERAAVALTSFMTIRAIVLCLYHLCAVRCQRVGQPLLGLG